MTPQTHEMVSAPSKEGVGAPGYLSFYGSERSTGYAGADRLSRAEDHSWYPRLQRFVTTYGLPGKRCLEIGSGCGLFQDMVHDYHGVDISPELSLYYHKPFHVSLSGVLPFDAGSFDAIWTIATFEHIPVLDQALRELKRVLKSGGVVLFAPAWNCRPWASQGYAVRPYRDLGTRGKLIKASIPLRDSTPFKILARSPRRLLSHAAFLLGRRYTEMRHMHLHANYGHCWTSDSDACNGIDPHDAILWFESNGLKCLSHPLPWKALFVRNGGLEFRKE